MLFRQELFLPLLLLLASHEAMFLAGYPLSEEILLTICMDRLLVSRQVV